MSRRILCSRYYRDFVREIITSLEKKNGERPVYRFKAKDLGGFEKLRSKGFRKLCSHGVIKVVGKDGNSNIYEISYDIICTIKNDEAKCRIRRSAKKL